MFGNKTVIASSLVLAALTALGFQNCGQFAAKEAQAKRNFLSANLVFSRTTAARGCASGECLPDIRAEHVTVEQEQAALDKLSNVFSGDILPPGRGGSSAPIPSPVAIPETTPEASPASTPVELPVSTTPPVQTAATPTPTPATGGAVGVVPPSRSEFPAPYACSSNFSIASGNPTLKQINEELKAVFLSDDGTSLTKKCEFTDPSIKQSLLENRSVLLVNTVVKCPNLAPGRYKLAIVRASQTTDFEKNLIYMFPLAQDRGVTPANNPDIGIYRMFMVEVDVAKQADKTLSVAPAPGGGMFGSFLPMIPMTLYDVNLANGGDAGKCSYNVSPLVVQLRKGDGLAKRLELSAPFQGIFFDILGENSYPAAHTKKRISWVSKGSAADHYFIVLPDKTGKVTGIDQMFGDNTKGPDGKFALNGYNALSKWDGRRANGSIDASAKDGLITAADAVFSSLRFWNDTDLDGVADTGELFTLSELGVESIDLSYDRNYSEMDRFGNKIMMKSVVKTTDGGYHVMYDIWFKISN